MSYELRLGKREREQLDEAYYSITSGIDQESSLELEVDNSLRLLNINNASTERHPPGEGYKPRRGAVI